MRIAICLSGLVRTYRQTWDNFKASILDANAEHQIDTFISTWPTEHSNNSMERTRREHWYGPETPLFPENHIDYFDIQDKYQPKVMSVDAPCIFDVPWYTPTPGCNIQSLMCMIYKIYACDRLRLEYERRFKFRYDVVIRMRFDTLMPWSFVVNELDLTTIFAPSMMQPRINPAYDWINDTFAAGNGIAMQKYSGWYLNLENMVKSGIPIQPEIMLFHHLTSNGLTIKPWGSGIDIVRPEGF